MISRRRFFESTGIAGLAIGALQRPVLAQDPPALKRPPGDPATIATNEDFWRRVASHYRIASDYTNLEGGNFGMMANSVVETYRRQIERVNVGNSFYARRHYAAELEAVRVRAADTLGVKPTEIVFTRGATEALQCLIGGYNRLKPGDAVMYSDLDYSAMQEAMSWLAARRGVEIVRIALPEPATPASILSTYAEAFKANPKVRLLLLTHLNNKTGLVIPVPEIVRLAREHDADSIVDAAHSFGQMDLKIPDLGSDFAGLNLHKWYGAPIGVGIMYIREGRLPLIDRDMTDLSQPDDLAITSRVHSGTSNFAAFLTVPAAFDFHAAVGPAHKAARLRYLRDRWVRQVRSERAIEVLTPDDATSVAAITSFRLTGRTSKEDNQRIAEQLLTRYKLFTVARSGVAKGDCVRVTPALYNRPEDCDRLAKAVLEIARAGG